MSHHLITQIETTDTLAHAVLPLFATGLSFKTCLVMWSILLTPFNLLINNLLVNMIVVTLIVFGISYLLGKFPAGAIGQLTTYNFGTLSHHRFYGKVFMVLDKSFSGSFRVPRASSGCFRVYEP